MDTLKGGAQIIGDSARAAYNASPGQDEMRQVARDQAARAAAAANQLHEALPSREQIAKGATETGKVIGDTYIAAGNNISAARTAAWETKQQMDAAYLEKRCDKLRTRQYLCGIPDANKVVKFLEGGSASDFVKELKELNKEIESIPRPQNNLMRGSDYCKWIWSDASNNTGTLPTQKQVKKYIGKYIKKTYEKEQILKNRLQNMSNYLDDMKTQRKEVEQLLFDSHCETYEQETECNANWGGKKTKQKSSILYCDALACSRQFEKPTKDFLKNYKTTEEVFERILYK